MIADRDSVVSEDVDLLVSLAAAPENILGLHDMGDPILLDIRVEVGDDLGILEIFRV